ncbi:hypothetical protein SAMN05216260_103198 [Streptomyces griseoaurantiacus]|uniref:Uncharacterized protein n=1 Tax=Streptomyces griseoaurantiacus TaxID=68213 RepID=A0A1G7F3M0_9ACTN|nr:hypothetical protein [Streptomyces sp. MH192]MCF0099187.1 hypothetical protein [Streptomyces sp. MH191]SDE70501.1 hypothetical protein SAMN05216260_103198 [Streptomyces jietaisiensis]
MFHVKHRPSVLPADVDRLPRQLVSFRHSTTSWPLPYWM